MSESYPIGGHTALARRWMANSLFGEHHNLALTFQAIFALDPKLADAVRRSEGTLHAVSDRPSLLERASALRQLAWEEADVVIAHVHARDVVPAMAFAAPGGPPVLLVNDALPRAIPTPHDVGLAHDPPPMPGPFAEYWASIRAAGATGSPSEFARQLASKAGLMPKADLELQDAVRQQQR